MPDRFILLRHGESETSVAGVASGDAATQVDLTAHGREQASAAGLALRAVPIGLCVTSRFLRARRTADLVLAGRAVPRRVLSDLDDLHFGTFEGRPLVAYRAWAQSHPMAAPVPAGESRVDLALRYCRALRELRQIPEETILVVAHGLPLTYLVRAAEGRMPEPVMTYLEPAHAYVLPSAALGDALERLETWAAEQGALAENSAVVP